MLNSISATQQSAHHLALFGDSENKKAGKLRVYDATWWNKKHAYEKSKHLHSHHAIDPITATAKDQHLFNDAYIPEKSEFEWLIEADKVSEAETHYLMGLLIGLAEKSPLVQLGKGQSKQRGLFSWQASNPDKPVDVIKQTDFIDWLTDSQSSSLKYTGISVKASAVTADSSQLARFPIVFSALSPILVNDPARVSGLAEDPKLEFYRNEKNQLIIPASSLMGVLRSQCRKIVLTLIIAHAEKTAQADHSSENKWADQLIAELFGSTSVQSKLWVEDAVAVDFAEHAQTFTAVDRFTGGVAEGALYTAHAASPKEIRCIFTLDKRRQRLENWQKGLLILLLRDALEADLAVGWGKSKGYGVIQLSQITLGDKQQSNWTAITEHYGIAAMQGWVESLNKKCSNNTEQELS